MKITTILGARPQFIKASAVSRALKNANCKEEIVHTGQHYDFSMSDIFFAELNIPEPNYHLGIGGGTHGQNTGRMIEAIEDVLLKQSPNFVLVYGDTDSTLAGALAAAKLHIPVAHIEAGLRSFNRKMPEEINRILTDHCSSILFTPTFAATSNLISEGIHPTKIKQVGDVMFDASIYFTQLAKAPNIVCEKKYILATIHRAENTNDLNKLKWIFDLLLNTAEEIQVILPLHPRTKKIVTEFGIQTGKILIIDPIGYLEMIWLINNSELVITDSGGLQKEAYFFKKQCITLRDETEWIELVDAGINKLLPPCSTNGLSLVMDRLEAKFDCDKHLYGEGNASERIAKIILEL